ncbi:MAG: spermidine/putrescine ABC transporter substrate-binding protein [Oscillospiraceae bacterium]|nr:spermidine/putrescine ABC transporter substrate-binding protein [Oscillospiraceae bacterium]
MRKLFILLMLCFVCLMLSLLVYAELEDPSTAEDYYTRFMGQNISLNVYNWGEYISDGNYDLMNVNAEFEALTGIRVYYTTYATNEELYSKLRGGGASYDVIIPSDYMISRMIIEDMLEPLDLANIPNLSEVGDEFLNPSYDPDNRYSVPYMWGITGIIYNTTMIDEDEEITSWDILWDQRFMGQILMFSNQRDAFGIAQFRRGFSANTTDPDELKACLDDLKEQKLLVQAYVMDEIFDKMLGGEAALAPYYAGDAMIMMEENPDLDFAIPEEGVNFFVDAACIPKGSRRKQAAEMYINFLCEPEVSAANSEYIGYATPITKALELVDEEFAENPIVFPSEEILANTETFTSLPRETNLLLDGYWTQLLSSDENYSRLLVPVMLFSGIILVVGINVYRAMNKKKKQKYYF